MRRLSTVRKRNKNKRQKQHKDMNCDNDENCSVSPSVSGHPQDVLMTSSGSSSGYNTGPSAAGGLATSVNVRPSSTTSKDSETEVTTSGYLR